MLLKLTRAMRAMWQRGQIEQELTAELQFHLDQQIAQHVKQGMTPREARREALRLFGGVEKVREECRDSWGVRMFESLARDLRYGLRGLSRHRTFAVGAVLTLALGIGANTAVFSAIDAVFFRPLPFAEPDRIVTVAKVGVPIDESEAEKGNPDITDLYAMRDLFSHSAIHATGGMNLGADASARSEPRRVTATFVTTEFFDTLGRQPSMGRAFTSEETQPGSRSVMVLSDRLWRSHFGGDPAIVGRVVTLDDVSHEIVGVMPDGFRFPAQADLWVPLPVPAPVSLVFSTFRNIVPYAGIARLAPGVTPQRASERLHVARQAYLDPESRTVATPASDLVSPLQQSLTGDRGTALAMLMASAGFVLLIACANVANLLLSRATVRRRELTVHAVLGASRGRVVRQLLVESFLLALAGAGAGLLVAQWSLSALTPVMPGTLVGLAPLQIDLRVLSFTLAMALLTVVLFGLWPALDVSRVDIGGTLKRAGTEGLTGAHGRLRGSLVVAEVALACLLTIGAGLMLGSLRATFATDLGMLTERVASARLNLPVTTYSDTTVRGRFIEAVVTHLREAPGVEGAAAVNTLPLGREAGVEFSFSAEGDGPGTRARDQSPRRFAPYLVVSPGYFDTMGIPLLRGRDLAWSDGPDLSVAVINQTMAESLWPDTDPIGKRFGIVGIDASYEVVGLVGDARISRVTEEPGPQMYLPMQARPVHYLSLVARGEGPRSVGGLLASMRAAVRAEDPTLPLYATEPMRVVISDAVAPRRTNTLLISIFGGLALCLSGLGVYSVLSYSVAQRRREIGVRMALGAQATDVVRLVVRQILGLATLGIVIGLAAAWALARYLESMLYGLGAHDPRVFATAPLVLLLITLLATWRPAHRAGRVEPIETLRFD